MTEAFPTLFSSLKLGPITLRNRIAMAPLTRQMAKADGTPTAEMAAYYARRARGGLGLIITEGTYEQDGFQSRAYLSQPGITNDRHQAGWAQVFDAVHAHGAKIIVQLMHGGRVCDPRVLNDQPGVSASATQSQGWSLYTDSDYEKTIRNIDGPWEKVTFPSARALTVAEIHAVADGFAAGVLGVRRGTIRSGIVRGRGAAGVERDDRTPDRSGAARHGVRGHFIGVFHRQHAWPPGGGRDRGDGGDQLGVRGDGDFDRAELRVGVVQGAGGGAVRKKKPGCLADRRHPASTPVNIRVPANIE